MLLPPGTVVGDRYVVDGPLGQGGMAVVYRVHHATLGTAHALKIVGVTSGSARERLLREGRLQGQLQHPNVVAVTDQLEIQGVPALVLELVDGPALSQLLGDPAAGAPPIPVEQVDALGGGILAGVGAAHRLGLVHRDLKPANVLVAILDGRAVPKVTDFGLAVDPDADDRRTRTGVALGTPQYMAPEQVRSAKDVDRRADVWALGVLLYELACGVVPFDDPDRLALFTKIAEARYTPLRERRADLPERMYGAVDAALQADRERRPADADALLAIWSPSGARDVAPDALTARALSLAPSASGGSFASALPPAATWAPPPEIDTPPAAVRAAPASGESSGTAEVRALLAGGPPPALPPPAVAAPPALRADGTPAWVKLGAAGGVGAFVLAGLALAAVLAASAGAALWVATRAPPAAPDREVVIQPVPVAAPPPDDGPRYAPPTKALVALADGRFGDCAHEAHFFLGTSDDASFLMATADAGQERWYSALEEVSKTMRFDPSERGLGWAPLVAGDADLGGGWLAGHPDDLELHLWRLWAACPGARCAEIGGASLEALQRIRPGSGLVAAAGTRLALATGDADAADAALAKWAAAAPAEPMVAVERARLALLRGEPEAVLADPSLAGARVPGAHAVRAIAALRLSRDVLYPEIVQQGLSGTSMDAATFARELTPALEALGRGPEALALLGEASTKMATYRDWLVATLRADLDLDRVALAHRLGRRVDTVELAEELRANAATKKDLPWAETRTRRTHQIAEGLALVARGEPELAARRLDELREIGVAPERTAPLADALR